MSLPERKPVSAKRGQTADCRKGEIKKAEGVRVFRLFFNFGTQNHRIVKRVIKYGILLALLCLPHIPAMAQDDDPFEDNPFEAQQSSMNPGRARKGSGWRPVQAANQEALVNAMLAQKIKRSLRYRFESVGLVTDGTNAPFWLASNRQGLFPTSGTMAYLRYGMFGKMVLPSTFSVSYGMDLGIGTGLEENWFVQQLYIDFGYRSWSLSVGAKERPGVLVNNGLSSGSLTWSGNSKPIPQVRAGVPEFCRLSCLDGWLSLKGEISYGMFTDDKWRGRYPSRPYTDNILFHSKEGFLKIGDRGRFPLELTCGLEMYAMFGGVLHNRGLDFSDPIWDEHKLPCDIGAYARILLPLNKTGQQTMENGNTLGSWHLALDWFIGKDVTARAYYEHFYEDHSSMLGIEYKADAHGDRGFVNYGCRRNWLDGLYGLEFNLPESWCVRNVVVEFLNTRGQCGPVLKFPEIDILEGVDGRDGMYCHVPYDSYSHHGLAIGSPVLLSPVYNADGSQRFAGNRVNMLHLGLDGGIGTHFDYRLKLTATRHWGTYERPFEHTRDILSGELSVFWLTGPSYSWKIGLSAGADSDDSNWLGNNRGLMLSIVKTWNIL